MHYEASTSIDAPAEAVWAILMDTARYPEWDPYCEKIEGQPALGAKLRAYSKLSPGRAFRLKVTQLDQAQRMKWSGGMPLGLFKGERTFTLSEQGGATAVTVREEFSGPMLRLIGKSIPDMTDAFAQFVAGLKQRAEHGRG